MMTDTVYSQEFGNDFLSQFIKIAEQNILANCEQHKTYFSIFKDIHQTFININNSWLEPLDGIYPLFIVRAHSSYLGAVRLSLSGQIPEAYMVIRGCVENALYGFYLMKNPDKMKIWLGRHKDDKSMKRVREEFKISKIWGELKKEDNLTYQHSYNLYNRTIDYGAHPNMLSVFSNMDKNEKDGLSFAINYLNSGDNKSNLILCFKNTAIAGIISLRIFFHMYPDKFGSLGIGDQLSQINSRLMDLLIGS